MYLNGHWPLFIGWLLVVPLCDHDMVDERVAIRQFCGAMPRHRAEEITIKEYERINKRYAGDEY